MRVVVTGTRDFLDFDIIVHWLRRIPKSATILHGANGVVDRMADVNCREWGYEVEPHPANWKLKGKAAGPLRNQEMLDSADACIAFWDGLSPGTKDTLKRARKRGIPTWIIYSKATARVTGIEKERLC